MAHAGLTNAASGCLLCSGGAGPQLTAALIAAFAALTGVLLTSVLGVWNARRALKLKRLEIEMASARSQIEEFYGPLFSLFQIHQATWRILCSIRDGVATSDNPGRDVEEIRHQAGEHVWQTAFSPVHTSIVEIIRTKLHLLDDGQSAGLFATYIQHVQMERVQKSLFADKGIRNDGAKGVPFPGQIVGEVERGLRDAKARYAAIKDRIAAA